MKFSLLQHLGEIQRKEIVYQCSLAAYTAFIQQAFDLLTYMPELTKGVGKNGPPFQTSKHNVAFLVKHFPEIRKDFAQEISDEVNFKFREVSEEVQAQLISRKEELKLNSDERFLKQKQSVSNSLNVMSKVLSVTRTTSLFSPIEAKQAKEPQSKPANLQPQSFVEDQKEEASWGNTDEMLNKIKSQKCKSIRPAQKVDEK